MNTQRKIFATENYKTPLRIVEDQNPNIKDKKWIFEGPCADFNDTNENNRKYSKEDYLRHFEYLLPQIENNELAGELDHNEDNYVPSMKSLSHIVRKLWYDEKLNQVWIRIELFDGDGAAGDQCISYVRKGFPIYISSRASGYIDEKGNVTLDTIYTFDIVYRPGFKMAKLNPVNESLTFKFNNPTSLISLYEWDESFATKNNLINNKNKKIDVMEYVTREDLNKFTETLNKTLNLMKAEIKNVSGGIKNGKQFIGENKNMPNTNDKSELDAVKRKLDLILEWSDIAGRTFNEYEKQSKLHHKHINAITERVNLMTDHSDLSTRYINDIKRIQESIQVSLKKFNKYADLNTESVNGLIDKVELHNDHANLTTHFVNDINECLKKLNKYADLNTDFVNGLADSQELIFEHSNLTTNFVNSINRKVERIKQGVSAKGQTAGQTRIVESLNKNKSNSRVDETISSVKKKMTDVNMNSTISTYPFISLLKTDEIMAFSNLHDLKKKTISKRVYENNADTRTDILDIINDVKNSKGNIRLFSNMPKNLMPVWESLNDASKKRIVSLYNIKEFDDDTEIMAFWESLNLKQDVGLIRIHENKQIDIDIDDNNLELGYSVEEVDKITK